jgi:hypothetical protein
MRPPARRHPHPAVRRRRGRRGACAGDPRAAVGQLVEASPVDRRARGRVGVPGRDQPCQLLVPPAGGGAAGPSAAGHARAHRPARSGSRRGVCHPPAVAALPRRQRTALVLRYYADLPIGEVAALMGCSPVTVKSLTNRAISALRAADQQPSIQEVGNDGSYRPLAPAGSRKGRWRAGRGPAAAPRAEVAPAPAGSRRGGGAACDRAGAGWPGGRAAVARAPHAWPVQAPTVTAPPPATTTGTAGTRPREVTVPTSPAARWTRRGGCSPRPGWSRGQPW